VLLKGSDDTSAVWLRLFRFGSMSALRLVSNVLSLVARAVNLLLGLFLNTCQLAVVHLMISQGRFERDRALFAYFVAGSIVLYFALESAHQPLVVDGLSLQVGKFKLLSVSG